MDVVMTQAALPANLSALVESEYTLSAVDAMLLRAPSGMNSCTDAARENKN